MAARPMICIYARTRKPRLTATGTREDSAKPWTFYADGGYIGVWVQYATAVLGDFGGGTIPSSFQPGQFLAALWEEFTGWLGETFGAGKVMAAPMLAEEPRVRGAIVAPPTGTVWKNYVFVGGQRVAVRVFQGGSTVGEVSFLLSDHLGSLSVVADASGNLVAQVRYTAFGEQRLATGEAGTDYRYTGQLSKMDTVGLLFYRARWFDPVTAHFASADTIIPGVWNPLAWDRYGYVRSNPINRTDPTGHIEACERGEECKDRPIINHKPVGIRNGVINVIRRTFGVSLSDSVQKWGLHDTVSMLKALQNMNKKLRGNLKAWVDGSTIFYDSPSEVGRYSGFTAGMGITFYADSGKIPFQNIYHEFGHLLNNACGGCFTNTLGKISLYAGEIFVMGRRNGQYDRQDGLGYNLHDLWDPNRQDTVWAEQHSVHMDSDGNTPGEEWADLWANYVSENFSVDEVGLIRYKFVNITTRVFKP